MLSSNSRRMESFRAPPPTHPAPTDAPSESCRTRRRRGPCDIGAQTDIGVNVGDGVLINLPTRRRRRAPNTNPPRHKMLLPPLLLLLARSCQRAGASESELVRSPVEGSGVSGGGRKQQERELSSDDYTTGDAIRPYTLPWWHPEIQWVAVNEVRASFAMGNELYSSVCTP